MRCGRVVGVDVHQVAWRSAPARGDRRCRGCGRRGRGCRRRRRRYAIPGREKLGADVRSAVDQGHAGVAPLAAEALESSDCARARFSAPWDRTRPSRCRSAARPATRRSQARSSAQAARSTPAALSGTGGGNLGRSWRGQSPRATSAAVSAAPRRLDDERRLILRPRCGSGGEEGASVSTSRRS